MSKERSIADRVIKQSDKSGFHKSRSDSQNHWSIKNSEGKVIGHAYEDGSLKGTNSGNKDQGKSGALAWLLK